MRNSLRWRFLIPFLALLVITLGGESLFLNAFVRNSYYDDWRSRLLREARLVAAQISTLSIESPPYTAVNTLARSLAQHLDTRVTIITPDGEVIGDSSSSPDIMENHADRPEVQAALSGREDTQMRRSGTLGGTLLYAAVPITRAGKTIAVARLAVPIDVVEKNLAVIQRTTLGVTALILLLAGLLTVVLTNYTIQPLRQLTNAAKKMSAGQFQPSVVARGQDEIAALSQAFNHMAVQLNIRLEDLEAERAKLAAVLAHMSDGVAIIDPQGILLMLNPSAARMFNTSIEHATGRTLIDISRQHQLVELWRRAQIQNEQHVATIETINDRQHVQAIISPLRDLPTGTTLLLLQDLTRIHRLEMVRRDFVSNVSHELRTPLASLKALSETLQEGALEDPPAARRFLTQMENEIDNLTQMVRELLELSRIESGRVPLEKVATPAMVLVQEPVARMSLQAERAGLIIRIEIATDLPHVFADRERIAQLLVNLLHNAIKFTPPGGSITVSAYQREDKIIFCVRDTGVGINAEELPRIFERFYKADRARSGGGTGLGLSIARHLVESHGGRIWVESQPGEGSSFFFSLPAA